MRLNLELVLLRSSLGMRFSLDLVSLRLGIGIDSFSEVKFRPGFTKVRYRHRQF